MIKKNAMNNLKEKSMNTMHLVYAREMKDPDSKYGETFYSYNTIYRNMPINLENKSKLESTFTKLKEYCDKNNKDKPANDLNQSKVEIMFGREYYETFGDIYPDICDKKDWKSLYNDYGQLSNGRQFFKKDYNPQLTKEYK
jgi:hypothetical protein